MKCTIDSFLTWPEDPAWPDPSGNDPYDVATKMVYQKIIT